MLITVDDVFTPAELAAAGPLGIAHVLCLLQDEPEAAMALCGVANLAQILPRHLRPLTHSISRSTFR